jgi:hypothetical protein
MALLLNLGLYPHGDGLKKKLKAPKGNSESPWSLHIRSSWKIKFINPPEVRCQFV